jgi:hypothetical protein
MKQTILTVTLSVLVSCGVALGTAKAGLWEKAASLLDMTVETTSFTIEAKGWNLRGYEFVTPTGARCVSMTGAEKGGLSCDFSKDWTKRKD